MNRKRVYLADLTHTSSGISALTFPLGVAFVASYAEQEFGEELDFQLFKYPEPMARAIVEKPPFMLAFSNYSWNLELSYKLSVWAKQIVPNLTVVFGGPNFPVSREEKLEFLEQRPAVDFYIQNEGEIGFVDLLQRLETYDLNPGRLKDHQELINNCTYLYGGQLVEGGVQRILDVNLIPSPYLSGRLDDFFDMPLVPMLETTRGCPFSCSFCSDGATSKNKVVRFDHARTQDELSYICDRVKNVDELIITDLNFGMYQPDIETAQAIAQLQRDRRWPLVVQASAGKNKTQRILETANILNGSWIIGSAVQSTDEEVLKNISRSNISLEAYREFAESMNALAPDASTYTEIILGLPGDTRQKHFESLRYGIESQVGTVRMYQAMLLSGTEMAANHTREKYELMTKWRIMPGGAGSYQFGDEPVSVTEMEEIIVGSKDMPFEDYVSCRVMNLLIETYVNNGLGEEVFSALRTMNVSVFDFILYVYDHPELYSPLMNEVLDSYIRATRDDLYDTRAEAEEVVSRPDILQKYLTGELGSNELLDHKALLVSQLDDTLSVLIAILTAFLQQEDLLTGAVQDYFDELGVFMLCRKRDIDKTDLGIEHVFHYDFERIANSNYQVDPNDLVRSPDEKSIAFYHDDPQKAYIQNAINLYSNHPGGIARMIQRSNLRKMYRKFNHVGSSI